MSNGHMLELATWGDDTIRLAFWDSVGGDDVIFQLLKDGTVLAETPESEHPYRVNLCEALRGLLEKLETRSNT